MKRNGRFFVYIVECADGTYYTGYSLDVRKRVATHSSGRGAKYTRSRRPVRLVWCKAYRTFKGAILEERKVKSLTRAKKERLVRGRRRRVKVRLKRSRRS